MDAQVDVSKSNLADSVPLLDTKEPQAITTTRRWPAITISFVCGCILCGILAALLTVHRLAGSPGLLWKHGQSYSPNEDVSKTGATCKTEKAGGIPVACCIADTNFDCGRQIGKLMRKRIRKVVKWYDDLRDCCDRQEAMCSHFLRVNKAKYPAYYEEIRGTAKGAGVSVKTLLYANIQEIYDLCESSLLGAHPSVPSWVAKLRNASNATLGVDLPWAGGHRPVGLLQRQRPRGRLGCTDYLLRSNERSIIGHNEDAAALDYDWEVNYFVNATIGTHRIFAYVYAGQLPGNSWGFNSKGMVLTMNALSARARVGLATNFVSRHILDAGGFTDALDRAMVPNQSSGSSWNIGRTQRCKKSHGGAGVQLANVETSPNSSSSLSVGEDNFTTHENIYLRLLDANKDAGFDPKSSLHRHRRLMALPMAKSADDVLNALSDTADKRYPVFRDGGKPDTDTNIVTTVFDLQASSARVWVQARRGHVSHDPTPAKKPADFSLDLCTVSFLHGSNV